LIENENENENENEIGIEIAIVPLIAVDGPILSNLILPSISRAQHCGHALKLHLAALVLILVRGFADNQGILHGGAFQWRSACDREYGPRSTPSLLPLPSVRSTGIRPDFVMPPCIAITRTRLCASGRQTVIPGSAGSVP
jgi:hypothetical protein